MSETSEYRRLIDRVRGFARQAAPSGAVVLVISRGDDELIKLDGATGWHFPRTSDGTYAGSHPADGGEAVAHLERARHQGAEFLLVPEPSAWWLDHYRELRSYLERHCPPPLTADDTAARLYDLRGIPAATSGASDVTSEQAVRSLRALAVDPQRAHELDLPLAQLIRLRLSAQQGGDAFESFQRLGLHVLPVHFYSPVPDTRGLPDAVWSSTSTDLPGVDWNEPVQLDLMRRAFPAFAEEGRSLPPECLSRNYLFEGRDALVYYCMIRHFRPLRVLEVGSGFSSRVAAHAALANGDTELTCIEPFPSPQLRAGFPGLTRLIEQPVQNVSLGEFDRLEAKDILFIDSTHVSKVGSDVNYLFLEVLPRLRPGVIVHVHDIFLPHEYPVQWVKQRHIFWNEQYLLRAFLMFNERFEVLLANAFLATKHPEVVKQTFPTTDPRAGASFWMRRTS